MYKILILIFLFSFKAFGAPFQLEQSDTLLYAKESIVRADRLGLGLTIASGGDDLYIDFEAGFGLSSDAQFIRIDIKNGLFNQNLPATGVAFNAAYTTLLSLGGSSGDDFAIIEVSAATAQPATTGFSLETTSFIWLDESLPIEVTYTLYDRPAEAINNGRYLHRESAVLAELIVSLGENFTQSNTHTATIKQDFLRFAPTFRNPETYSLGDASATLASVGKFLQDRLLTNDVRKVSDSVIITDVRDILTNINTGAENATISGNLQGVRTFLNNQDDCAGATFELNPEEGANVASVSLDTLISFPVFCIEALSNTEVIKRGKYLLDLGFGLESALLGEVVYDASSFDLPYVANNPDFEQFIHMVNYSIEDVRYVAIFYPEEGSNEELALTELASGIVSAESRLKLDVKALVDLSVADSKQLSGRVFIDAGRKDFSAAHQIYSIESTDVPQLISLDIIEN